MEADAKRDFKMTILFINKVVDYRRTLEVRLLSWSSFLPFKSTVSKLASQIWNSPLSQHDEESSKLLKHQVTLYTKLTSRWTARPSLPTKMGLNRLFNSQGPLTICVTIHSFCTASAFSSASSKALVIWSASSPASICE